MPVWSIDSIEDRPDVTLSDWAAFEVPLTDVKNLAREKWDWALPDELLRKAYASLYLDLAEGLQWTQKAVESRSP